MNGSYIYDVNTTPYEDHSTSSYEYHKYFPTQNSDFNNFSALRIVLAAKDHHYHFHNAFLELKGRVVQKANGEPYPAKSGIAFINNPVPHMFRNITYKMDGRIIESVDYPGHVSTMFHHAVFNSNVAYENGLSFYWSPDKTRLADTENKGWELRRKLLIEEPTSKGSFVIRIPLRMLMGFGEYTKVITGVSHEFEMTRQEDYYSLFRGDNLSDGGENTACLEGKIDLKSLLLWVPIAKADGVVNINLKEHQLNSKTEYQIAFYQRRGIMTELPTGVQDWSWSFSTINFKERPQYLIIGFQADSDKTDQTLNCGLYDNSNVKKMTCMINDIRIPYNGVEADFANMDLGNFYTQLQDFGANYLQLDPLIHECGVNPIAFKNLRTLFAFDLTKHERDIRAEVVNSRIEVHFGAVTPANLRAYACIINKKEIFLKSDGGNLVIR